MNKLQEYTASIPDSNPNKAGLIRQWKIENKWGEKKPEPVGTGTVLKNEETEEFKGLDLAKTIDVATTPASVTSVKSTLAGGGTSTSGDGNLKLNEDKLDNEKEEDGTFYGDYLKQDGSSGFEDKPYEVQLEDFKNLTRGMMDGSHPMSVLLEGKTPEEKEKIIWDYASTYAPKYTKEQFDKKTGRYNVIATEESKEKFEANMPLGQNYETQEDLTKAIHQGIGKTIQSDPLINYEINRKNKQSKEELAEYKIALRKKYDLSTPEGLDKANSDLKKRWQELVVLPVTESDLYKNTVADLSIVGEELASEINSDFAAVMKIRERGKSSFFSFTDAMRQAGAPGADFIESLAVGASGMIQNINSALVSVDQTELQDTSTAIRLLKEDVDSGVLKGSDKATFGGRYSNKEGYTVGAVRGTVDDKLEHLQNKQETVLKSIAVDLEDIKDYQAFSSNALHANLEDGVDFTDIVRLVAESAPQMGVAMAGTLTGNPVLAGLGFMSMFATEYGSNYMGAIEQGLTNDGKKINEENILTALKNGDYADKAEAAAYAFLSAGLEYGSGLKVAKNLTKALGINGSLSTATASLYKGEVKNFVKSAVKGLKSKGKSGLTEALTEGGQGVLGQMSIGSQLDVGSGKYIDNKENWESAQAGGYLGVLLPFGGSVYTQTTTELRNVARDVVTKFDLSGLGANMKAVNGFFMEAESNIKAKFENGDLTEEEYKNESNYLNAVRNTGLKIPKNFSEATKKKVFDLILQKNKIEQDIQGLEPELVLEEVAKIKEINETLAKVSATEKLTINVVKAKGNLDIEIIQAKDATEAKKLATEKKMNLGEDSNSTGYISGDGKTIVVDMKRAAELGEVNTAAHELLHGVLFNTLYSINNKGEVEGKNVVRGLSAALMSELNAIDSSAVENTEFAARLELYKNEPSSVKAEEVLTLFADALYYGDIKYDESIFTKLGDFVRRVLQNAGYKNIEFNNGKDVYNFLKDYNRGVERGNLGKEINKVAKEGAKVGENIRRFQGPEAVPRTKKNKASKSVNDLNQELERLVDNEFEMEPGSFDAQKSNLELKIRQALKKEKEKPKAPKSDTGFDVSETSTIGQINNLVPKEIQTAEEYKQDNNVQREIDKAFSPNGIISNIIKGRFGAGELGMETLESVKQRALKYNPAAERKKAGNNQPVTFSEFIFSNVNFGRLDAAKKLAIEAADKKNKTDLDNKEAQSIANEESSGPTADNRKKYVPLINNTKMIPSFVVAEIKTKLVDVISKLTSKLSTKPKGANAQTTPLIAEIKKAIGNVVIYRQLYLLL